MNAVPVSPRRLFGLAFLGPDVDGRSVWVCRAHPGAEGVRVESIEPVAALPAGPERAEAILRWLCGKVLEAPRSGWGVGAPLGLPRTSQGSDWAAIVRGCVETWPPPDVPADALRRTDRQLGLEPPLGPERAQSARHVHRGLLAPMLAQAGVVVLPQEPVPVIPEGMPPQMAARAPSTYLVETAPAAVAAALLPQTQRAGGLDAVRTLVRDGHVRPMARRLRARATDEEGGFAALLCAVGVGRAMRRADHSALHADADYRHEGFVYC